MENTNTLLLDIWDTSTYKNRRQEMAACLLASDAASAASLFGGFLGKLYSKSVGNSFKLTDRSL